MARRNRGTAGLVCADMRCVSAVLPASIFLIASTALDTGAPRQPGPDRLAAEIARWAAFLGANTSTDEIWKELREGSAPLLEQARSSLHAGQRLLALQRLLAARANLSAAAYMQAPPASGAKDLAAFDAEWTRMGAVLMAERAPASADALAGVRPAAVRVLGEAALPQARVFYDASLDYGRNTTPEYGLFYLGSARAAAEAVELCRSLSWPSQPKAAALRSLRAEIEALEQELLASYRPPLSIDRHPDFIAASSLLNEARELDVAGLRQALRP